MKIIPSHDFRALRVDPVHTAELDQSTSVSGRLNRKLRDLRVSVTDRCNLRCRYCMPKSVFTEDYAFLPRDELLSFEEIERVARVAVTNEGRSASRCRTSVASVANAKRQCYRLMDNKRNENSGSSQACS